jgi:hypothetical protein
MSFGRHSRRARAAQHLRLVERPGRARGRACPGASIAAVAFLLDSGRIGGGCTADLTPDLLAGLEKGGRVRPVGDAYCTTVYGTTTGTRARLESLCVGPFSHHNVLVATDEENLLSLGYLSRYAVTFDFPAGVLYLEQGKRFAEPDEADKSGLHFLRAGGRTVVKGVDEGSPAARCGIKAEDVLLEIAGVRADRGALEPLRRLLRAPRKEVRIRLKRGEKEILVSVPLTG